MRAGRMPGGFAAPSDPIGHGMDYDASIPKDTRPYVYGTLALRTRAIAPALPRQGNRLRQHNQWTQDNSIEMKRLVAMLDIGLHYQHPTWGAHLYYSFSTNTLEENSITSSEDLRNSYGIFMVEWRY